MSSQTVRRKPVSARKAASAQGKARKVQTARAKTGSALDAVMAWVPLSEQQLHQAFLAVIIGGAAAMAWFVASLAGVPALAQQQLAIVAADAGFEVKRVEVRGVKNLNELKVYEKVLAQRDRAMPLVDVEALRADLLELSWIEDARVSRQLPDTLVVDIVERSPHAVLRKPGRLVLIDDRGNELEPVSKAAARGRLIVSGPGAGRQVVALNRLFEAAPALKSQVREAQWIGNRRWNLTFKTGQVLALPEGSEESAGALVAFARLDGANRLLGGRFVAFDMRAPDRIYLRKPGTAEPESQVVDSAPAAARQTDAPKVALIEKPADKPAEEETN